MNLAEIFAWCLVACGVLAGLFAMLAVSRWWRVSRMLAAISIGCVVIALLTLLATQRRPPNPGPGIYLHFCLYATPAILAIVLNRSRRIRPGCCPRCGYNLTGNTSGVCSECGLTATPSHEKSS
jgi:hypothetical protein